MAKASKRRPHWDGCAPTIFNDEHSKIGFKFVVCAPITLGLGEQPQQTLPGDVPRGRHDQVGTIFFLGGDCPLRIWEGKNRPKFGAILGNFTLCLSGIPKDLSGRSLQTRAKLKYSIFLTPRVILRTILKLRQERGETGRSIVSSELHVSQRMSRTTGKHLTLPLFVLRTNKLVFFGRCRLRRSSAPTLVQFPVRLSF